MYTLGNTDKAGFINLFNQCRNKKRNIKEQKALRIMTGVISINLKLHCPGGL